MPVINGVEYHRLGKGDTIEVGDLCYIRNSMSNTFYNVIRVTKTQAILDGTLRYKRVISGSPTHQRYIGQDKWNMNYATFYRKASGY